MYSVCCQIPHTCHSVVCSSQTELAMQQMNIFKYLQTCLRMVALIATYVYSVMHLWIYLFYIALKIRKPV